VLAVIHINFDDRRYKKYSYGCNYKYEVSSSDRIIVLVCFDYEFPELENLIKPIKQKKNIEPEKLEERPYSS
jgi:hypothetical protein